MDSSQVDYSKIIIDTLNSLLGSLLSSIDNTLYSILDKITFIDSGLIKDSLFSKTLDSSLSNSLIVIANSLLVGFCLYYCGKLLLSQYTGNTIEKPSQFAFKAIIFSIFISFSYFICEQILSINYLISESIRTLGKEIYNTDFSFNNLIVQINSYINSSGNNINLFSFDGILKSFISFGLLNLLFSYALRYIMVKVLVLFSPFALLSLVTTSTSWIFKSWLRSFISLLLLQSLISLIFLIIFSFDKSLSSTFSQLMYIGAIYALIKANSYIKELFGGISTDVQSNINSLKSLIK